MLYREEGEICSQPEIVCLSSSYCQKSCNQSLHRVFSVAQCSNMAFISQPDVSGGFAGVLTCPHTYNSLSIGSIYIARGCLGASVLHGGITSPDQPA